MHQIAGGMLLASTSDYFSNHFLALYNRQRRHHREFLAIQVCVVFVNSIALLTRQMKVLIFQGSRSLVPHTGSVDLRLLAGCNFHVHRTVVVSGRFLLFVRHPVDQMFKK